MAIKTFTTGEVLTASDTNTYLANAGLVYVSTTTFTNQTNADILGCFTSTYDHYVAIIDITASLSAQYTHIQLLNGTTAKAVNYVRAGFVCTSASVLGADAGGTGAAAWALGGQSTSAMRATANFYSPNLNTRTSFMSTCLYTTPSNTQYYSGNGEQTENYVATGFRIVANGNAATYSGTVTVYGYRKA